MTETTYEVTEFGAVGDGKALDTDAIQSAIDTCSESGGGTVALSPGTYLSGGLRLKDDVRLHVLNGAVLKESSDMDHYDRVPKESYVHHTGSQYGFLRGVDVQNVTICGEGTIDGNMALDEGDSRGPLPVVFEESENVTVKDVTVTRSPGWSVTFWGCQHVEVLQASVIDSHADGIDPCCCQDVLIDGTYIENAGDDSICLKNDSNKYTDETAPDCGYLTRDVVVTNTTIRNSGHPAIKIGTGSFGVFRNIVVSNCTIENTGPMFAIQLMRNSYDSTPERCIENVIFADIVGNGLERLVDWTTLEVEEPVIRNVTLDTITLDDTRYKSVISGLPDAPIQDVVLSNVSETMRSVDHEVFGTAVEESTWLMAKHVDGLTVDDVRVTLPSEIDSTLKIEESERVDIDHLSVSGSGCAPVIDICTVDDVFVHNTMGRDGETVVGASGEVRNLQFAGNGFAGTCTIIDADRAVPSGAVRPVANDISYEGLTVLNRVAPDESLTASVTVLNEGAAGAVRVPFFLEDAEVRVEWLWLDQGESETVAVELPPLYIPGDYTVEVGPLSGTGTVDAAPAEYELDRSIPINVSPDDGTVVATPTVRNVGGEQGTESVSMTVNSEEVASDSVTLGPGESGTVELESTVADPEDSTVRVAGRPSWEFATFGEPNTEFRQQGDSLVVDAGGARVRTISADPPADSEVPKYSVAYESVNGDYTVTTKLTRQEGRGIYASAGLIVANDVTDYRSAGRVVLERYPKYGGSGMYGADYDGDGAVEFNEFLGGIPLPIWFRISRDGDTFTGYTSPNGTEWTEVGECRIPGASDSQHVGVVVNSYQDSNIRSRAEFDEFRINRL